MGERIGNIKNRILYQFKKIYNKINLSRTLIYEVIPYVKVFAYGKFPIFFIYEATLSFKMPDRSSDNQDRGLKLLV